MPTYLCHGFRWHRRDIRIFVIMNNLEDAAPDWIIGRASSSLILGQFAKAFTFLPSPGPRASSSTLRAPLAEGGDKMLLHQDDDFSAPPSRVPASDDDVLAHEWSPVKLLEEYDLTEKASAARPYAYVADYVVRVDLSANVADEMARYQSVARDSSWFDKLRDQLQAGERIQWYVVVCADEERAVPEADDSDDEAPPPPPPVKDDPILIRQKQQQHPKQTPPRADVSVRRDWQTRSGDMRQDGPQADFLADDPFKSSPQPGLRHKLSTKGLRRLFSKREGT